MILPELGKRPAVVLQRNPIYLCLWVNRALQIPNYQKFRSSFIKHQIFYPARRERRFATAFFGSNLAQTTDWWPLTIQHRTSKYFIKSVGSNSDLQEKKKSNFDQKLWKNFIDCCISPQRWHQDTSYLPFNFGYARVCEICLAHTSASCFFLIKMKVKKYFYSIP